GFEVVIVSTGRPPTEWMRRHGIEWVHGPSPSTARSLVRNMRRNGLLPAASTALRRRPKAGTRGHFGVGADVIYAPWINTLTANPRLLAGQTPVVTSCRGRQITIAPWNPAHRSH